MNLDWRSARRGLSSGIEQAPGVRPSAIKGLPMTKKYVNIADIFFRMFREMHWN
jgi:hypothetical protein